LGEFDGKQSSRGCRVDAPWYARQEDFEIIHQNLMPVVRLRVGRKWARDKNNRWFLDPNITVTLKSIKTITPAEAIESCQETKSGGQEVDTFTRFPEELRTEMLTWLPSEDVAALRLASRSMSEVQLSARFWYSRLNAPELHMVHMKNMKHVGAEQKNKKDLLIAALRLGLSRTRIARMAYEALWYVKVCSTIRNVGIERPRWLWGSQDKIPLKVQSSLRSGKIPLPPQWFSVVSFDHDIPFQSVKSLTMFFHSPRRYTHYSDQGLGEIEYDRYLTGIRFQNGTHSKDLGHCHGQDIIHLEISGNEWFDSLTLRIDTNNSVSVQSVFLTDGNVKKQREIYWSRLTRPFRARFEEMSFSDVQEIEMGMTRECRVVVFDTLVPDPDAVTAPDRKRRRM
jgi:hypothetical protein